MFNGIIYNTGKVISIEKTKKSIFIGIFSNTTFKKKDVGSSISCNGVCLTLVKIYKLGYSRVLIETGLNFLNTVIKNELINNLYLFKSNRNLKKIGKNNISSNFLKKIKLKPITINLNSDKLFIKEF